jgi:hypothetical protein
VPGIRLLTSRDEILAFRRDAQGLNARSPWSADSLRRAAWAGLQDSMPRAALLSIHARVADTKPTVLEDPSLVQVWGPRLSVFVIARKDLAPFTLGRHPDDDRGRRRAEELALAMAKLLGRRELTHREVGRSLGVGNAIRYATTTGTLLIRWEGALGPTVRTVEPPPVEPFEARRELARRFLHVYGPTDALAFARWAGISARAGRAAFAALESELLPVKTSVGDRFLLTDDESALRSPTAALAPVRLLPSGDAFYLLQGADRELVVPDPARRAQLWTSRVWPGAVLMAGEIVGTWRRAKTVMDVEPWRRLRAAERAAIEAEAASLPLPGLARETTVRWAGG